MLRFTGRYWEVVLKIVVQFNDTMCLESVECSLCVHTVFNGMCSLVLVALAISPFATSSRIKRLKDARGRWAVAAQPSRNLAPRHSRNSTFVFPVDSTDFVGHLDQCIARTSDHLIHSFTRRSDLDPTPAHISSIRRFSTSHVNL